jgi:hypothetical protein
MNCDATARTHGRNELVAYLFRARVIEDADADVLAARCQLSNARSGFS